MKGKKAVFGFVLLLGISFQQSLSEKTPVLLDLRPQLFQEIDQADSPFPARNVSKKYATDQVLVKFKSFVSKERVERTIATYRARPLKRIPHVDVYQLKIPEDSTVEEMTFLMGQNPDVEYVGPNYIARIAMTPNDTFFNFQYALHNTSQAIGPPGSPQGTLRADIKAPAAWEETQGDESLLIAILDTGVDVDHPDLVNKINANGYDFVNDDPDPIDDHGHGTFVAGIAAAETNNNEGIAGVAWNCQILPFKVLDEAGEGFYSWIIDGIITATDRGASVINFSLGGTEPDPSLQEAVQYAYENGVIVVAAAGNEAGPVIYPAAYDECLAVAATDYNDARVPWSNFGPEVDVAAPGERIISLVPTWYFGAGSIPYGYGGGTSFSCPYVAGMAALIMSLKPWLTIDQVIGIIQYSCDDINESEYPGRDDYIGYGRINMEKGLVPIAVSPPSH